MENKNNSQIQNEVSTPFELRDIGRICKYLILVIILYSYLFSGSFLYILLSLWSFVMHIISYPIQSMFSDFGGFGISWDVFGFSSLSSLSDIADHSSTISNAANVMPETIQNIVGTGQDMIPTTIDNVMSVDYSTTIGKIIRALIG